MKESELTRLIILGAGASVDCGVYPTGADLIEFSKKIIDWLVNDQTDVPKKVKPYLKNLVSSGHSSIDSYISSIGDEDERKFLKSYYISIFLFCTAYSEIVGNFENGWYAEISKLIIPPLSSVKNNEERIKAIEEKLEKLQIITFNYDISLEIFLRKGLENFFKKSENDYKKKVSEALEAVCKKIHHVYGSIAYVDEILEINFEKLSAEQISNNITTSIENEVAKKQKNFVETLEETKSSFLAEGVFEESAEVYKKFKDIVALDQAKLTDNENIFISYSKGVFTTVVDVAEEIKNIESTNYFSSSRIKVISEERQRLKEEISNRVFDKKPDLLYVLGYGFDETNNEILSLKEIKYQKGCFVTNFGGNERLQRLILDESLSQFRGIYGSNGIDYKEYFIPLISSESVSKALKEDFSLLENPTSPLKVQTNLTPYLELKK